MYWILGTKISEPLEDLKTPKWMTLTEALKEIKSEASQSLGDWTVYKR